MKPIDIPERERAHIHIAELRAILGGQRDPFARAWDGEMSGDERQFWTRVAGLGGYAWSYAGREWAEINGTHQTQIKAAVRKTAARAALLLGESVQ